MGILAVRAGLPQVAALCFLGLGASLAVVGCDTKSNKSKVSSSLFLAPIRASGSGGDNGITQRSDRLDTLLAIRPNQLPGDLENVPTEPFVLGRASARNPQTGEIQETDDLLFFEAQSRSVLTQDICTDSSSVECGRVRLAYNSRGLDTVQNEGSILSTTVTPIKLKNGWIMTFDTGSKNLIAFREEPSRLIVDGEGVPQTLRYRSADLINGTDISSENFGLGNGVVLSVVISGEDMADQLPNVQAEPIVSNIFEVEENKVLVLFSTGTIRAVHMLELSEEELDTTFDLDDPANPNKIFKVRFLRGTFKLFPPKEGEVFPQPFLSFSTIAERITGDNNIILEAFQPVLIPGEMRTEALMYDTISSTFMRVGVARLGGEITGSTLAVAIPRPTLISALQDGGAGDLVSPPFLPSGGFANPDKKKTEIIFTEEVTNNVLAYDYRAPLDKNLRIFVSASDLSLRRTPGGGVANVPPTEPFLGFATDDVTANRLVFDRGLDQLLSVSYTSSVVVIVADNQAIGQATNSQLAEFTYIEPLDENRVRAFDTVSNSLVEIRLDYAAFPVRFK